MFDFTEVFFYVKILIKKNNKKEKNILTNEKKSCINCLNAGVAQW